MEDSHVSWAAKNGKPVTHGYKIHITVDEDSEIVRATAKTTGLSVHDLTQADRLINQSLAKVDRYAGSGSQPGRSSLGNTLRSSA